ncbi:MAG: MarR family transcriptional regulator [Bacteroidetes bacterium]|nr:MarR family transcriptional regulator [Bacteroidota bacterium]
MLDQLINLVKENAGEAIINNAAIPNENNDEAIQTTAGGILDALKGQLAEGGIENISSLFQQGQIGSHPMVSQIGNQVAGQLASRFGLDPSTANNMVQQLVPTVMNQLVSKTNDPNDSSFDLGSITQSLAGGNLGGILNNLGGLFGK